MAEQEAASTESTETAAPETSLFGQEMPSDAELMGGGDSAAESLESSETSSSQAADDQTTDTKFDQKETEAKQEESSITDAKEDGTKQEAKDDTGEDGKADEKSDSPDSNDTEKTEQKHVPGFVDIRALQSERGKRQNLQRELDDLKARVDNPLTPLATQEAATEKTGEDFKRLSGDEFKSLAEDDPAEAAIYLQKQSAHDQDVAKTAADKMAADNATANEKRYIQTIGDNARSLMGDAIPGFHDPAKTVNSDLVKFADENGFSAEMLVLTMPETMMMMPGSDKPQPMGDMAAHLVISLNNMRAKMAAVDPVAIEKEVTERVTSELMLKMRTDTPTSTTSFMDSPGASGSGFDAKKILTPGELSQLSEKEMEAYLGG